jgi:hypothetical protein
VALLFRLQVSSIMLTSFTLGVFLPFIHQDFQLSPLQAGLLQGMSWITAALRALPSGVWFSRFCSVPLVLASLFGTGLRHRACGDWAGDASHRLAANGMSDAMRPHQCRHYRRLAVSTCGTACCGCGRDPELTVNEAYNFLVRQSR